VANDIAHLNTTYLSMGRRAVSAQTGVAVGHEVSNLDELRKRITELANAFLPDGLNPFVDVFDRVRARREMGELINEATTAWHRQTPGQFIEMLFHNDGRLIRKVTDVYGKKARIPVATPEPTKARSYTPRISPSGTMH
jgi:hypothetical protein